MAEKRGRKPGPHFVDPYEPRTLVGFVARRAILVSYGSYSELLAEAQRLTPTSMPARAHPSDAAVLASAPWKSVGGLLSSIDRATREEVGRIQALVNRRLDDRAERWYLAAFYDSVSQPSPLDVADEAQTEGALPSHFFLELANAGPARSKPEVAVRGMAMRSFINETGLATEALVRPINAPPLRALEARTLDDAVSETLRDLAIVACAPPASGGMSATRLLAEAGTRALDAIQEPLLGGSPIAWKLVRVVTAVLQRRKVSMLTGAADDGPLGPDRIATASAELLRTLHEKNPPCIYRARSLWEEAAGRLPKRDPRFAWVDEALVQRAAVGSTASTEEEAPLPVRERMTAAWVYFWRLARAEGWHPTDLSWRMRTDLSSRCRADLEHLIDRLEGEEENVRLRARDSTRDRGLTYAGHYLRQLLDDRRPWWKFDANEALSQHGSHRHGPDPDAPPEAHLVRSAVIEGIGHIRELDEISRVAIGALVTQACLTIDGVARRECLTTLQYAQLGESAARVFGQVIYEADRSGCRWLLEAALFGLGWMQRPQNTVDVLIDYTRSKYDDSIRHTALMAIGDMAEEVRLDQRSLSKARQAAHAVLDGIDDLLVDAPLPRFERKLEARSALYVLSMLRSEEDLERLNAIVNSQRFDEITTPALAQWGIDRINIRRAVDSWWPSPTVDLEPSDKDRAVSASDLRRLVDPMQSLRNVQRVRDALMTANTPRKG